MNNDIVQLTDKSGNNIYPIAGGATQDSISKSMLAEGVFEGPELFPSPNEAYVRTENIVDGAVTSDKIDYATLYSNPSGHGLGSFTLSDSIQNYSKIEVEFRDSDGNEGLTSFKVIPGTNKTLITTFQPGWASDKTYYIKSALVSFTGTSASIDACKEGGMPNGSSPTVGVDSSTIIKIYSVVGYK